MDKRNKVIDELLEYFNHMAIKDFLQPLLQSIGLSTEIPEETTGTTLTELIKKLRYLEETQFHPDFNSNFNLVLMIPPHLSAPEYEEIFGKPFEISNNNVLLNTVKFIPILVQNITLPSKQVRITESKLITGSLPVPEEVSEENQFTITFYNNYKGHIYSFHKLWIEYIDEVGKGLVKPNDFYIENGYIDFTASFFILSFTPTAKLKKLIYIPMAIPTSINPNEVIKIEGNDVNTLTVNYSIYTYDEFDYFELEARGITLNNPQNHPFLEKLHQLLTYWVTKNSNESFSTTNYSSEDNTIASNSNNNPITTSGTSLLNNTSNTSPDLLSHINIALDNFSIDKNSALAQLSNKIQKLVQNSNIKTNINDNNIEMYADNNLSNAVNTTNIVNKVSTTVSTDSTKEILNKLAESFNQIANNMEDNKTYQIKVNNDTKKALVLAYKELDNKLTENIDDNMKQKIIDAQATINKIVFNTTDNGAKVTKDEIQNLVNTITTIANT